MNVVWLCDVVQVWCNTREHHPVWSKHWHGAHHRPGCPLWMCRCHLALSSHVRTPRSLPWHPRYLLLWCLPQVSLSHSEWGLVRIKLLQVKFFNYVHQKSKNNFSFSIRIWDEGQLYFKIETDTDSSGQNCVHLLHTRFCLNYVLASAGWTCSTWPLMSMQGRAKLEPIVYYIACRSYTDRQISGNLEFPVHGNP